MKHKSFAILLTFLFACSAKQADTGKGKGTADAKAAEIVDTNKSQIPNPNESAQSGKDEDSLAIPTNIAGAYLTCAVRKEATDQSLESEIGCRLTDADTGRKVAPDAKLSFSNSEPNTVTSELQPDAAIYHVLYRIKGETRDAILQATQSLEAIVLYADKNIKTEMVSKVLKPAIELDDYEAPIVREQTIDKDDGGSL